MSVVTRGLGGGSLLVTRGFGPSVSLADFQYIQVEWIDNTPVLFSPDVVPGYTVQVPLLDAGQTLYDPKTRTYHLIPLVDASATLHEPALALFNFLDFPSIAAQPTLYVPHLQATFTAVIPLLEVGVELFEPHIAFDQFVEMLHLLNVPTLHIPTLGTGELLDIIEMSLGIRVDHETALGIKQQVEYLAGIAQSAATHLTVHEIEALTMQVEPTILEVNLGIAQAHESEIGVRQVLDADVGVRQDIDFTMPQTLDY